MKISKHVGAIVAIALIVIVSTALNLSLSARSGKLSMPLIYDDVVYLLDASRRLLFDNVNSMPALFNSFLNSPPHSPLSTLTALLGFSLFGLHTWSPYVADIWILMAFCTFVYFVSRKWIGEVSSVLVVAIMMFAPVTSAMITEFRPDSGAAVIFVIAIYLLLNSNFANTSIIKLFYVGVVCVLAIMAKPSAFIVVIPILGVAWFISIIRFGMKWREALRGALVVAVTIFILSVPCVLIWGQHTIAYVYQVFVTNSDIWSTPGDIFFHLTFHSFGPGGRLALGSFLTFGLAVIAIDICVSSWLRMHDSTSLFFYLVVGILYFGMAFSTEKSIYQGSFFYIPFLIVIVIAIARVAIISTHPRIFIGAITLAVVALLPPATLYTTKASYPDTKIMADEITQFIHKQRQQCADRILIISALAPYPITPTAIALDLVLQYGSNARDAQLWMNREPQKLIADAMAADFVLLPNSWGTKASLQFPAIKFVENISTALSSADGWDRYSPNVPDAPILYYRNSCR